MSYVRTILIAVAVLLCMPVHAKSDEETIRSLEDVWNNAHLQGDTAALASLWADDLVIVVPKMEPMDKPSSLQFWKKVPIKFTRYSSELSSVRVYRDTAIAGGTVHRARKFGDRPEMEDSWYFTKVYRRHGNGWQVVAYHASEMPQQKP